MKTKPKKRNSRLTEEKVRKIKLHIQTEGYETMKEIARKFDISYWQARKVCLQSAEESIQFQGDDPEPVNMDVDAQEIAPYLMFMNIGLSLIDWDRAMPIFIRVLEEPACSNKAKETAKKLLLELGSSLSKAIKGE